MKVPFTNSMELLSPLMGLVALAVGLILIILMIYRLKKRPETTARLTTAHMLSTVKKEVRPRRLRKAAIPTLILAGLLVISFGIANPAMATKVATENSVVCQIVDVSLSMGANDVEPTRDEAMRQALKATILSAPVDAELCVVSFAGAENVDVVIEPSLNREEALERIDSLTLQDGTAAGEGIMAAIEVVQSLEDSPLRSAEELLEGEQPPVAFVLLSDGASFDGRTTDEAAYAAAELGIPVHAISFGVTEGVMNVNGQDMVVTPDTEAMQRVADITDGESYEAVSSGDLQQIFDSVTTHVATETSFESVGNIPTLIGALLLMFGLGLGVLRNGRTYV